MKVAEELVIKIEYDELLKWVKENFKDYDIERLCDNDSFFRDGNLYLKVTLK